jgi:predicted secreted protein
MPQWLQHNVFALDRLVSKPILTTRTTELIESLDAPGATYLAYTPNGKKLVTAGVDNYCRVFTTGSDDEPVTVDECQENNTAVVAGVRNMI